MELSKEQMEKVIIYDWNVITKRSLIDENLIEIINLFKNY